MKTAADPLEWLHAAPPGTLVPVDAVREALRLSGDGPKATARHLDSWRERLWTAPPETRLGVKELAAAVGHSPSWVWKRTRPGAPGGSIPHRKRDAELVFLAGEVRAWLTAREAAPSTGAVLPLARRRRGA